MSTYMKFSTKITISVFLSLVISLNLGCNNNNTESMEKSVSAECKLKINTFNFKNLKIGMDLSQLKNLKKDNELIELFYGKNVSEHHISAYRIKDIRDYTIFERKIKYIYLQFFKGKLYNIEIVLQFDISAELAKKFELENCIKNSTISAENEKLKMYASWEGDTPWNKTSKDYYLKVSDKKTQDFIDSYREKKVEERKFKIQQDF